MQITNFASRRTLHRALTLLSSRFVVARKATRLDGVENDASAKPQNLLSASRDLDL